MGAVFGKTGYVRDRDAEFSRRNVPREELLRGIDATLLAVERGMAQVDDASWDKPYPLPIGGYSVTIGDALTHLVSHLGYHLGQVDYHRRMVTGDAGKIGAVAIPELPSATPTPTFQALTPDPLTPRPLIPRRRNPRRESPAPRCVTAPAMKA